MCRQNWPIVFGLLSVVFMSASVARAADRSAPPREPVDHPFALVAFASVDRIRSRAQSLADAVGLPDRAETLFTEVIDDYSRLVNSPGLDTTRPIGMMSYPKWFGQHGAEDSDAVFAVDPSGFATSPVETLASLFAENCTIVLCLPVRDRPALLETVRELLDEDTSTEVEGKPGWLQLGDDVQVGYVGNYLYVVADDTERKQFDLNFPEFGTLARTSLGRNGFVYSLYRRGLSPLVRDVMLPAFQLVDAARFQQRDDEPETAFRLRTMFGPLQRELLDLALFHVEEFRIGGHVDSATRETIVEVELVGPRQGKLAKFCNTFKVKGNPFVPLASNSSSPLSMVLSLSLPQESWKPVADAVYQSAASAAHPDLATVWRTVAKTIESGQLDLYVSAPSWREGLIALRVNGNDQFPERMQQALGGIWGSPFKLDVDRVESIPIHRSFGSLGETPLLSVLGRSLPILLAQQWPSLSDFRQSMTSFAADQILFDSDGKNVVGGVEVGNLTLTMFLASGSATNSVWLAATSQAIWLGFGSFSDTTCPDWFKSQVSASLESTASRRTGNRPFQLTVRGLGASLPEASADSLAQQAAGTDAASQAQAQKARARGDVLRDLPNAIHGDFRPTDTGVKFSLRFEEAYFQWFAMYFRDSSGESATEN